MCGAGGMPLAFTQDILIKHYRGMKFHNRHVNISLILLRIQYIALDKNSPADKLVLGAVVIDWNAHLVVITDFRSWEIGTRTLCSASGSWVTDIRAATIIIRTRIITWNEHIRITLNYVKYCMYQRQTYLAEISDLLRLKPKQFIQFIYCRNRLK